MDLFFVKPKLWSTEANYKTAIFRNRIQMRNLD